MALYDSKMAHHPIEEFLDSERTFEYLRWLPQTSKWHSLGLQTFHAWLFLPRLLPKECLLYSLLQIGTKNKARCLQQ